MKSNVLNFTEIYSKGILKFCFPEMASWLPTCGGRHAPVQGTNAASRWIWATVKRASTNTLINHSTARSVHQNLTPAERNLLHVSRCHLILAGMPTEGLVTRG